jgi:hypothetical protein
VKVTWLVQGRIQVGDKGAKSIADALKENISMQTLNLVRFHISGFFCAV